MWGLIPAAGAGSRLQPLAFSKELLPIGSRSDGGRERPRAVSEYLLDRMIVGGADKLCMVVAPSKGDILGYYGRHPAGAETCYVVQPEPSGLCDALFQALPFIAPHEQILAGLPDTLWFPEDGYRALPDDALSFLLFPVDQPQLFDAVVTDHRGRVEAIEVKAAAPRSSWIWGGFKLTGAILRELHALWLLRDRGDEYLGTLVNAYLAAGGQALGVRAGSQYVDTGTFAGYQRAVALLRSRARAVSPACAAGRP